MIGLNVFAVACVLSGHPGFLGYVYIYTYVMVTRENLHVHVLCLHVLVFQGLLGDRITDNAARCSGFDSFPNYT